ncbi:hypothetical protein D9613_003570 [Agrocybe pediades]|uniref:HMG box domain-containing protein n=1 Tax=Agrocybe pediades TaxID=84607 RepID=A0A8H4VL07_9AGAR|nr:hypothetical protein D9613_003570 [Agrocybe pediades]
MPATRLANRRRRSSHAIFTPARPGHYGVSPPPVPPERPVTFAPNVTPVTYHEEDADADNLASLAASANPNVQALAAKLFPPSTTPAPPPTRKRCPPGKRLSQGYIPRPPNAFMLFRADFVRQKHVPGSIETDHGSLSRIIGTCWRQLPLEEKRVWEIKAKQEKAAHKARYPDYRFRPVHNKKKNANAVTGLPSPESLYNTDRRTHKSPEALEEERRCEEVAQLLLQGKKGEELARAVKERDRARGYGDVNNRRDANAHLAMPIPTSSLQVPFSMHHHPNHPYHRRSSSVPLPNEWLAFAQNQNFNQHQGIALPSVPTFSVQHHGDADHDVNFDQEDAILEQFTNPFLSQTHQNPPSQQSPLQLFAPQPQSHATQFLNSGLLNNPPILNSNLSQMMFSNPRSSFGMGGFNGAGNAMLGHRRASSAQATFLRRSWTMDDLDVAPHEQVPHNQSRSNAFSEFSFRGNGSTMLGRDPNPLPDVNAEYFSTEFSFGPSMTTPSSAPSTFANFGRSTDIEHGLSSASTVTTELPVDPATPLSAIQPIQHTHSHHHHSNDSLSGIDVALAGVTFSPRENQHYLPQQVQVAPPASSTSSTSSSSAASPQYIDPGTFTTNSTSAYMSFPDHQQDDLTQYDGPESTVGLLKAGIVASPYTTTPTGGHIDNMAFSNGHGHPEIDVSEYLDFNDMDHSKFGSPMGVGVGIDMTTSMGMQMGTGGGYYA